MPKNRERKYRRDSSGDETGALNTEGNDLHRELEILKENPRRQTASKDRFWLKTTPFFIVILFLLLVIGITYGLQSGSWLYRFAHPLATYTHFPIALVGVNVISYPAYVEELSILQNVSPATQIGNIIGTNDLPSIALTKSIRGEVLKDAYDVYSISVSEEELADEFERIYGYEYTSMYADELVQSSLGMTPSQFVHGLLQEYMLKNKLTVALANDQDYMEPRRESIRRIVQDVNEDPERFDAYIAGSMHGAFVGARSSSFFRATELTGVYANLKNLEEGEISDVIDSKTRLSVFRLAHRLSEGSEVYLELQELYIPYIDANLFVEQQLRSLHVSVFLPSYHWESSCQSVVLDGSSCNSVSQETIQTYLTEPQ